MRAFAALCIPLLLTACGREPPPPAEIAEPVRFEQASADRVAHGERLSRVLGCSGCHLADLTGEDWTEPGFGKMWTANLTRVAAALDDRQLAAVIRSGRRTDGSVLWEMPSHLFTRLDDGDMAALIAFIRSKQQAGDAHPRPEFEQAALDEIKAGLLRSSADHVAAEGQRLPPDAGPNHALGQYLVKATCAECHGMELAGGKPYPTARERPDLRVVVPAYDEAAFDKLLSTGVAAGDRELELMSEVARSRYAHFTPAERRAVHAYLTAVAQQAR